MWGTELYKLYRCGSYSTKSKEGFDKVVLINYMSENSTICRDAKSDDRCRFQMLNNSKYIEAWWMMFIFWACKTFIG